MDENHEVNQTAALGSHHNTFAGTVNNYGLSVTDATRMALQMFREYYPQLQKEALDTVQKLVEEHLKLIPPENIIPPKANVVVPVLQNASLTEEPDLLKMYATVLANSMDKFMQSGIHPGFVDVIRQLSSDEAKILKYMNQHSTVPTVTLRATDEKKAGFSVVKPQFEAGREKVGKNGVVRDPATHREVLHNAMGRQSGLAHEYFSAVLDSFKVRVEQLGYDITFINRNLGGKTMTYLEHCHYRGVDGAVIACVDFTDPQVIELVNSDVPVVTIDHVFNNRMAVLSDNVAGLSALVRTAYSQGHRRIAFIHGERTAVTENRLAGFYKSCDELGLEVPDVYVREGIYHDAARCAQETKALLALPQRPTCILFPDDFSAMGGYNAIAEAGLSIPEDISVMGYDGIYLSRVMKPQLATYQQNTMVLGRTAADKLVQMIEHPRVTLAEQLLVTGKLLEGDSVGRPAQT